ncbi:hypothetical protein NG895_15835 [Aeoliella sp. ICT_H6.2]|uniref:Uncharacterized protein n=1 Tax=Aeoliella straminimaris TaxID=2954799 RepID=A0A9X2FAG4_9BACT|nr:hypothetical protein [Aeoliella straminimaris]MCO6045380.1 hypothetical protein [Aeoliella straminimaris]
MKKLGMFLMMLTVVGYTIGCSKPETTPSTDDTTPPAAGTGDSDAAPPAEPAE